MYKIKYTEKNNNKANDFETRALLYLLTRRDDSNDIFIFFIDCLNDLTGSSDDFNTLWDTQAKGVFSLNPTKIGGALITLFENYVSDLNIIHYVLLIPKIKEGYLLDESLDHYKFNNFKNDKKAYLINGLKNEYFKRNNITTLTTSDEIKLSTFLDEVLFVVGDDKESYIKDIIKFKNKDSLSNLFYTSIFNEIRDKQSSLKNINLEGVEINHPSELVKYKKYLKSNDIKIMVLNRFVGNDIFKPNYIPISYFDEIKNLNKDDLSDLLQENNSNLSRTFFNKNNKVAFWQLLESIMILINENNNLTIRQIYSKLDKNLISKNHTLNEESTLFFISLIMDGTS